MTIFSRLLTFAVFAFLFFWLTVFGSVFFFDYVDPGNTVYTPGDRTFAAFNLIIISIFLVELFAKMHEAEMRRMTPRPEEFRRV